MARTGGSSGSLGRDDIIAFYQRRVRERLHIVLAFSPIGSTFRKRMLQYPSFANCKYFESYQVYINILIIYTSMRTHMYIYIYLTILYSTKKTKQKHYTHTHTHQAVRLIGFIHGQKMH